MKKIGITGGIGSGKSIVCEMFKTLGIPVYNSDFESKQLLNTNQKVISELKHYFGETIYSEKNIIDKKKFAEIIFSDNKALDKANSIIHPAVREHFALWVSHYEKHSYILKEAAILFESGAYKDVDKVITVFTPLNLRIERIKKRDKTSVEAILKRINNQMSDEEKIRKSDFVIYNDEISLLIPQILSIHEQLCR